jgi:drug/metabolite transporter (DMT)-like permease
LTRNSTTGLAAAGTAVTSWGLGNVMARFIALTGPSLSFDRQWVGVAYSLVLCAALRRRLGWRTLRLALPGGLAFGVQGLLFFTAVKHTAVTDATIIVALQPALLLCVVGRLFGERVRGADVAATATALAGTVLVVLGGRGRGGDHLSGDLLAGASLVLWAAYFVAAKQARRQVGTIEYQTGLALVAAGAVTPVALYYGSALWTGWGTFGWVVLLALGPGGGHFLMNWAHEHVSLTIASLFTLGIPVVTMGGAAVILGDHISVWQLLGTGVVLSSLAVVVVRRAEPTTEPEVLPAPPPAIDTA